MPEVKKRKSPIGYTETIIPDKDFDESRANAYTGFTAGYPATPSSAIRESQANNLDTLTHERIHQGQLAARDNTSKEQVINTILNGMFQTDQHRGTTVRNINEYDLIGQHEKETGNPSLELPAYQFEQYDSNHQLAFNNYMNLMRKNNPETSHNIQAPMPTEYQKGYVNSGPEVQAPQIPMQEMSLLDMLVRMISKKK